MRLVVFQQYSRKKPHIICSGMVSNCLLPDPPNLEVTSYILLQGAAQKLWYGYHYKQFEKIHINYIDLFHATHYFKHAFVNSAKYVARHDALNGRLVSCEGHNCIEERGAAIEVRPEREA